MKKLACSGLIAVFIGLATALWIPEMKYWGVLIFFLGLVTCAVSTLKLYGEVDKE